MICPRLNDLPQPPPERTGWPWTDASTRLPERMPDGSPWPRISIVTPSFNQSPFIEETIRSVLLQGYPNLEYIVIDGGSTDNTVEIINKYSRWILYWTSEEDQGQADAINKGFAHSSGDILGFLNSDDIYAQGALVRIGTDACAVSNDRIMLVYPVEDFGYCTPVTHLGLQNHSIYSLLAGLSYFHQPGVFWYRSVWVDAHGFDISYRYCFDRKFFMKALAYGARTAFFSGPALSKFRWHAESKSFQEASVGFGVEIDRLVRELGPGLVGSGLLKRQDLRTALALRRQIAMDHMRSRLLCRDKHGKQYGGYAEVIGLLQRHPGALGTRFFWGTVKDAMRAKWASGFGKVK